MQVDKKAPLTPGQMKALNSIFVAAIPADLPHDVAQRWIGGNSGMVGEKIREMLLPLRPDNFSPRFTPSQERASQIMGSNFLGINQIVEFFGIQPKRTQLAALAEIPFFSSTLEACRESHVLVPTFPCKIQKIMDKQKLRFYGPQAEDELRWYPVVEEACWQLIRKTPVPKSINRDFDRDTNLLIGDGEYVPSLGTMIYSVVGYYLATGERLYADIAVYCYCSPLLPYGGSHTNKKTVGPWPEGEPLQVGTYLSRDQDWAFVSAQNPDKI